MKPLKSGSWSEKTVADALDAIKRNAAQRGLARDSGRFHVHEAGAIGGGKLSFVRLIRHPVAGHQPAFRGTGRTLTLKRSPERASMIPETR